MIPMQSVPNLFTRKRRAANSAATVGFAADFHACAGKLQLRAQDCDISGSPRSAQLTESTYTSNALPCPSRLPPPARRMSQFEGGSDEARKVSSIQPREWCAASLPRPAPLPRPHLSPSFAQPEQLRYSVGQLSARDPSIGESLRGPTETNPKRRGRVGDSDEREERQATRVRGTNRTSFHNERVRARRATQHATHTTAPNDMLARTRLKVQFNKIKRMSALPTATPRPSPGLDLADDCSRQTPAWELLTTYY